MATELFVRVKNDTDHAIDVTFEVRPMEYAINNRWDSINRHVPNIITKRLYADEWTAIDEYSGVDTMIGTGRTEQEAVDDLIEKMCR